MTTATTDTPITDPEAEQVERANASGRIPVVFAHNADRGPLLTISADQDHTVPWAIANASYKRQRRNEGVTEIVKLEGRGHALTIDSGWREVADKTLEFVSRFQPAGGR